MSKILILFFFVISSTSGWTQDSVWVHVTVISKTEQETVQNVLATITNGGEPVFKTTNMNGEFWLHSKAGNGIEFKLSHSQFASTSEFKRVPKDASDTIDYTFEMEFLRTKELQEQHIYAPGIPEPVYESSSLHVSDFEMQNDGNILLLTYPKRLKKGSELIIFDGEKDLINFQVPSLAKELVRDYRGNAHVVCEEMVYGIHRDGATVGISQVPKNYYLMYIAPIVDTNYSKMYFSNYDPDYPAFDYFVYDQLDSTYKVIMGVEDEEMMEHFRAEYKWVDVRTKLWAKNLELQTGVDAEVYVGKAVFARSIYYEEVYAPLFHRNDSLLLFDYYKDKLYTFNITGEALDSVEIYHHYNPKSTGWKKELIQDRKTGHIYALFERGGYTFLGHVDPYNGEIRNQVKLKNRYVDKVAVHKNFVYYIYREFESTQKKTLYRERLPYSFSEAKLLQGDNLEVHSEE